MTNTSIKLADGTSDRHAKGLAPEMHTTPEVQSKHSYALQHPEGPAQAIMRLPPIPIVPGLNTAQAPPLRTTAIADMTWQRCAKGHQPRNAQAAAGFFDRRRGLGRFRLALAVAAGRVWPELLPPRVRSPEAMRGSSPVTCRLCCFWPRVEGFVLPPPCPAAPHRESTPWPSR